MLDKQLDDVVTALTPDIYQRLATAVELGKWPDGVPLTPEQKENCLQDGDVMAITPQRRCGTHDHQYRRRVGDEK